MSIEKLYITNDVEGAGSRLGHHPILSWGACVVTREPVSFEKAVRAGLLFYRELRPASLNFEEEALRVAARELMCLGGLSSRPEFNPDHNSFDPVAVLRFMQTKCMSIEDAVKEFHQWIKVVGQGKEVEGVTDTVFYDSGRIDLCLGSSEQKSPYGWSGTDLDSLYRGYTKRKDANLRELNVPDTRIHPHRADEDAHFLADIARELLYVRLGW